MDVYEKLKNEIYKIANDRKLLPTPVSVRARALSTEEAIGNPEDDDYPLQKGKEKLMQAEFQGAMGQAYTDRYGNFEGTLEGVLQMSLKNNFRRAVFVATINAVLRRLGWIENTIHCHDQEPVECAAELASYIQAKYGAVKIALIGFQPRMVQSLSTHFDMRVLDMDEDNIGTRKFGVEIEEPAQTASAVNWANLLTVTGTTLVNDTISSFLNDKPIIFYGTTIAGASHLMGWERFCARSH